MKQYLDLLRHIRENGVMKEDRTGVGTQSIFGHQMRFDLSEEFPLLTTKKVHLKSIIYELLWFISGDTNIKYLKDHGVSIWDEWADENGDLGPVYGHQWRSWPCPDGSTIDQLSNVVETIRNNPDSRRMNDVRPGYGWSAYQGKDSGIHGRHVYYVCRAGTGSGSIFAVCHDSASGLQSIAEYMVLFCSRYRNLSGRLYLV